MDGLLSYYFPLNLCRHLWVGELEDGLSAASELIYLRGMNSVLLDQLPPHALLCLDLYLC